MLHYTIDASSSMKTDKWSSAMELAAALAYVSTMIPNFHVVISVRAAPEDVPIVLIIFDSSVDRLPHARKYFPRLYPFGSTPEGLVFEAIHDIVCKGKEARKFFLNVSDGMPHFSDRAASRRVWYQGYTAIAHTRRVVNKIRNSGIGILSYYVTNGSTGSLQDFKQMYGSSAKYIDVTNFREVSNTLNELFLEK
jgi:hypothetical protein